MDPLRPFSDLIRSLWKSSTARVQRAQGGTGASRTSPQSTAPLEAESGSLSLRSEIRSRIRQIGLSDPRRVREVFVETVIARELGLGTSHAADLTEIAERVAARIGSHSELSDRLHTLLVALAEDPAAG
ncbi:MAG TPA: hypothetical protein VN735_15080 [Steroidobacteraceae bacterium]|nr:hypothetical protein [Steroidobacteraceae bacterium]